MNVRRIAQRMPARWPAGLAGLCMRRGCGVVILVLASALLLQQLGSWSSGMPAAWRDALGGGLMAALATALGTLPVLLSQSISRRTSEALLGFGAGVMLAATAFSLVMPALAAAQSQDLGRWASALLVAGAIAAGALALGLADRWLPGHAPSADGDAARALRRAWIFVGAISLHNLPEGLAIGVAFAGTDPAQAQALAAGISIQDVPEGLVVALALRSVGYGRVFSVALGVASGLVEPVAALGGAMLISVAAGFLPVGLALAAGAMLYAVGHEAIPGAHAQGPARHATAGLVLGFALMMVLDTALAPG